VAETPRLAVVIVSWNSWADLEPCLRSVEADPRSVEAAELVVVDCASTDGTPDRVSGAFPRWQVVRCAENLGFARGNNVGFACTSAPYVLLLNPDTTLLPGCVDRLVAVLDASREVGAVSPLKLNGDGSDQPSWGRFPTLREELLRQSLLYRLVPVPSPQGPCFRPRRQRRLLPHGAARDVDWCTASGLLVRRAAVSSPLFAEGEYLYREEVVLCRRLRSAGWRVRFEPDARMVHLMGTSVRRERARTTRLRLRGEALYFELCGNRWQRWASALLQIAGCSVRSAALGLVALLGGARGRARAASAGAYLAAAVERSRSLGAEATND
jgi:GT2 family glycosyltransferase